MFRLIVLMTNLFFSLALGAFANADTEVGNLDCRGIALSAGYAFAQLNGSEIKTLEIRREEAGKPMDGTETPGRWYLIRDPKGDVNFCAIFITTQNNKCSVYEIRDNTRL
jgi:hypothetical protein